MKSAKRRFGKIGNSEIYLFEFKNENGLEFKIMNYGATITSISIPDRKEGSNVVCGFDSLEEYLSPTYRNNYPYFGCTVGRYANRIKNGKFFLEGRPIHVTTNEESNHLHGGSEGFDKKIWDTEELISKDEVGVKMTLVSPHLDEGFPGELKVEVTFSINNQNEISISYYAESDRLTPVSLTNHSYFNLSGFRDGIESHYLQVRADRILEKDDSNCAVDLPVPTTELLDFRNERRIGETEIDDYFVFNDDDRIRSVGRIGFENNVLQISTNESGAQIYTANFVSEHLKRNNKEQYGSNCAICFEAHGFPNGINIEGARSSLISPDTPYQSQTNYKFSWVE